MFDVFISYSHDDDDSARAAMLADALRNEELSVWWDAHIFPGDDWHQAITQRLQQAKCVIVLWSAKSISSKFVRDEAGVAMENGKLIPAKFGPVDPPLGFKQLQYTDLTNWSGESDHPGYQKLLLSITQLIDTAAAGGAGAQSQSGPTGLADGGQALLHPPPAAQRPRPGPFVRGARSLNVAHARGEAQHVSPWLCWLFYSALAVCVFVIDPFGVFATAQRLSQDSANRIFGPLYPTTGRDQVSVVLWRDSSLNELEQTWPIPLDLHARALSALLSYRPKAVFVDIAYTNDRGDAGVARLRESIREYAAEKIPLLFAAPADAGEKIIAGLADDLAAGRLAGVPKPIEDGFTRQYAEEVALGEQTYKTAAFQLLQKTAAAGKEGMQILSAHMKRDIEVVWGTEPHPINREVMEECGKAAPATPWQRIVTALLHPGSLIRSCPYSPTIPVHAILDSTRDRRFAELIEGRYVILGVAVQSAPDEVMTPVNGRLSGPQLHAMALDNLLTFGAHYKSREPAALFTAIKALVVVLILGTLLASTPDRSRRNVSARGRWLRIFAAGAVVLAIATAAAAFTFVALDLPPADAIGPLGLALAITLLAKSALLENMIGGLSLRRASRAKDSVRSAQTAHGGKQLS